jgi:hypothetical protein
MTGTATYQRRFNLPPLRAGVSRTTRPARSGASRQVPDSSTKKSAMKNRYPLQNSASKVTIDVQYTSPDQARRSQSPRTHQPATCNNSRAAAKNRSISPCSQVPRINRRLFAGIERPRAKSVSCSAAILRHGSNSRHDDYRTGGSPIGCIPDRLMNRENRDPTRFGHRSIQRYHQACEGEAGWRVSIILPRSFP